MKKFIPEHESPENFEEERELEGMTATGPKPKQFEYLGKVFTPIVTGKYNWKQLSAKLWGSDTHLKRLDCINENGYKHEDFYKVAKENGCGKFDVFEMDGEKVIPCNRLMYYGEPTWYTMQKEDEDRQRALATFGENGFKDMTELLEQLVKYATPPSKNFVFERAMYYRAKASAEAIINRKNKQQ